LPIGRDKVRPNWPIDIVVEEMFREFVVKKHGVYTCGLLGQEANKAYLAYMKSFLKSKGITAASLEKDRAHTHIKIERKSEQEANAKIVGLRDMIVRYLIERRGIKQQPKIRVGHSMLREAICGVTGLADHRSIKSRITLLESSRLISKEADMEFKLYEIITGYKAKEQEEEDDHKAKPPRGVVG
jgi:hypothetical protein